MSASDKLAQLRAVATALINAAGELESKAGAEADPAVRRALFRDARVAMHEANVALHALTNHQIAILDRLTVDISRMLDRLRAVGAQEIVEAILRTAPFLTPPKASPPPLPSPRPDAGAEARAVLEAILSAAQAAGVDADLALAVAQVESGLDPKAEAETDRSGLFAVPDAAWLRLRPADAMVGRAAAATPAQQAGVVMPEIAAIVSRLSSALQSAPRDELVLAAWRFGQDAALDLARTDPDRPAQDIVERALAEAWGVGAASVAALLDRLRAALIVARDRLRAVVAARDAPAADQPEARPDASPEPSPSARRPASSPAVPPTDARRVALSLPIIAVDEMKAVSYGTDGSKLHDNHREFYDTVLKYLNDAAPNLKDSPHHQRGTKKPWSAAFISYCVRKAVQGVPGSPSFPYSVGHHEYIMAGIRTTFPGFGFGRRGYPHLSVAEGPRAIPRVGDLVGHTRDEHKGLKSFDAIKRHIRRAPSDKRYFYSHCDIVTEVRPGRATVIGGNTGRTATGHGTIDTREIRLTRDGTLVEDGKDWFVVRLDF